MGEVHAVFQTDPLHHRVIAADWNADFVTMSVIGTFSPNKNFIGSAAATLRLFQAAGCSGD